MREFDFYFTDRQRLSEWLRGPCAKYQLMITRPNMPQSEQMASEQVLQ